MKLIVLDKILNGTKMDTWSMNEIRDRFCSFLINYGYCKYILDFDIDSVTTDVEFEEFAYGILFKVNYSEFTDILEVNVSESRKIRYLQIEKVRHDG